MGNIKIASLDRISIAAEEFISQTSGYKIFAFYGEMGVGKTTLIKEICKKLHVVNMVSSPSFSIINEYITDKGDRIYHFDFYRINKIEEAFDLGIEEYFYSNNLCFIEWPEKIEALLPVNTLAVKIRIGMNNERIIEMNDDLNP
ncbi:MAG: tRNA (adenosine(37)-N6)-threonylcarbamoyltransferase complex ATPase subunit type 1 TsaE [Bacteroidetes bacterium RIFOXYA12_FULL_35_11]|nr:MAG: tRNA (adenosine(37)-N6)-threonylcarbamoyltransferase complex ATPase subunit type 1 TsaE [Bacteroidetes bacterium GWF2_35_48]OFY79638.1 MAG: tRNA (adenosine(37)-N6)-threonylcarbamoyltransferase complex ATPase subunit type 1 TsaE [Bacteroidetes bacterium RIFOXYA12_FULL_35_11]OFY92214.1 MAG: tRNA (adenosine(37)-N6)-threonylcarbamoyltransferase complex ATPase subunit type 1 TsaE [Bacteroidetes bacterium RIFOXYB2_FULL_35_7]OFY95187.1 MAG: tRNA (adenosine(37)-N6)-threonylcarbamoyltransferase c